MEPFLKYLEKFMWLGQSALSTVQGCCNEMILKEGEFLWRAGEIADGLFFLKHGSVRLFFYDMEGKDQTFHFVNHPALLGNMESAYSWAPSENSIQVLSYSEFIHINNNDVRKINDQVKGWDKLLRKINAQVALEKQNTRSLLMEKDPVSRFKFFYNKYAAVVRDAPPDYISSYLQIPVETIQELKYQLIRR